MKSISNFRQYPLLHHSFVYPEETTIRIGGIPSDISTVSILSQLAELPSFPMLHFRFAFMARRYQNAYQTLWLCYDRAPKVDAAFLDISLCSGDTHFKPTIYKEPLPIPGVLAFSSRLKDQEETANRVHHKQFEYLAHVPRSSSLRINKTPDGYAYTYIKPGYPLYSASNLEAGDLCSPKQFVTMEGSNFSSTFLPVSRSHSRKVTKSSLSSLDSPQRLQQASPASSDTFLRATMNPITRTGQDVIQGRAVQGPRDLPFYPAHLPSPPSSVTVSDSTTVSTEQLKVLNDTVITPLRNTLETMRLTQQTLAQELEVLRVSQSQQQQKLVQADNQTNNILMVINRMEQRADDRFTNLVESVQQLMADSEGEPRRKKQTSTLSTREFLPTLTPHITVRSPLPSAPSLSASISELILPLPMGIRGILSELPFEYVNQIYLLEHPDIEPQHEFNISPMAPLETDIKLQLTQHYEHCDQQAFIQSLTLPNPVNLITQELMNCAVIRAWSQAPDDPTCYNSVIEDPIVRFLCKLFLSIAPPLSRWPPEPIYRFHQCFMERHTVIQTSEVHLGLPGVCSKGLFSGPDSLGIWHTTVRHLWYSGFLVPDGRYLSQLYDYTQSIQVCRFEVTSNRFVDSVWVIAGNPSTYSACINMDVQIRENNNIIQKSGGTPGTLTFRGPLSPSRELLYAYSGDSDYVFVDNLAGQALISLIGRIMHEGRRENNAAQFVEMGHLMCGLAYHLHQNTSRWNFLQIPHHTAFFKSFLNGLLQYIRGHDVDLRALSPMLTRCQFIANYRIINKHLSEHLIQVHQDRTQAQALSITYLQSRAGILWEQIPAAPSSPTQADDDSSYHPTVSSDDLTHMDVQLQTNLLSSLDDV